MKPSLKIIFDWSEFLPPSLSPFGYNETVAQDYFHLTKEEALRKGFSWKDDDSAIQFQGSKYVLQDTIQEESEEVCKAVLHCEITGKPYKVIAQEFDLCKKMKIPISRLCPDERHRLRMLRKNPRKIWTRQCPKCNEKIQTTYSPERPEIVYCESCYLQFIY